MKPRDFISYGTGVKHRRRWVLALVCVLLVGLAAAVTALVVPRIRLIQLEADAAVELSSESPALSTEADSVMEASGVASRAFGKARPYLQQRGIPCDDARLLYSDYMWSPNGTKWFVAVLCFDNGSVITATMRPASVWRATDRARVIFDSWISADVMRIAEKSERSKIFPATLQRRDRAKILIRHVFDRNEVIVAGTISDSGVLSIAPESVTGGAIATSGSTDG